MVNLKPTIEYQSRKNRSAPGMNKNHNINTKEFMAYHIWSTDG